mgnify:FL=1
MIKHNKNNKIVLGLSGGVDSSVCAYLLKKKGYDVTGLFMQNWDPYVNSDFKGHFADDKNKCDAQKDFADAKAVAKKLKIKVYFTEFISEYWKKVFQYVIDEYKKGNTPNPDILCNKYIKFDLFIKYAKDKLHTDKIAMGHYASSEYKNKQWYLVQAKDKVKDQTYFLCWLNQNQLAHCIFPLGKIEKTKVREIAKKQKLINWNKKDSTGICFIGERKFKEFLKNYIKIKRGDIIDIETNKIVGKHEGIMFYTIGQNRSLGLGGQNTKYFVCKKDNKKNIIYVCGQKHKDKYLSSTKAELVKFNWINDPKQWKNKKVKIRFRHTGQLVDGKFEIKNDKVIIKYKKYLSVACGQFAVLYYGKYCLGGGIINKVY